VAQPGIKELLEAGVHFGHQTRRWNPKMRRFLHGERDGIYIIDLLKTKRLLDQASEFAGTVAHRGGSVLFVGTKKQARDAVREVAEATGMPYVNHRWLGGLLTNFQTMSERIRRLHDLERYETEGQLALLPTRERLAALADLAKLRANLGGVKNMKGTPAAIFIIDLKTEAIAVREAQRLRIPIIGLVDTNCDPDGIDFVIPGNDDAIRSCAVITRAIGERVGEGAGIYRAEQERLRAEAEERARREAEERAKREAEIAAAQEAEAAAAAARAAAEAAATAPGAPAGAPPEQAAAPEPVPTAAVPAPPAAPSPAPAAAPAPEPAAAPSPEPEAAKPEPAAAPTPEPEAAQPEPEAAQPEPEAAQPEPEAAQPEPEAAQPEPEAATPEAVAPATEPAPVAAPEVAASEAPEAPASEAEAEPAPSAESEAAPADAPPKRARRLGRRKPAADAAAPQEDAPAPADAEAEPGAPEQVAAESVDPETGPKADVSPEKEEAASA
jgi:small subunit ribosomal protein S2